MAKLKIPSRCYTLKGGPWDTKELILTSGGNTIPFEVKGFKGQYKSTYNFFSKEQKISEWQAEGTILDI